jgi:uncharacterized membrane protein
LFLEGIAMNKNACFMRWWLLNAVLLFIGFVCWRFGVFHAIYHNDSSYLCFVIMGIFCWISGYNGTLAYSVDTQNKIETKLDLSWFFSEICLALGMIGTVVGFIQMLSGFSSLNVSNTNSIQGMIVSMSSGMATALYTTLAGLIFGNLIKLQAFDIEKSSVKEEGKNEQA